MTTLYFSTKEWFGQRLQQFLKKVKRFLIIFLPSFPLWSSEGLGGSTTSSSLKLWTLYLWSNVPVLLPRGYLKHLAYLCYLQTGVLAHAQASHPHVGQQHLTAGVSDEIPVFGRYRQLQTGGVAPVLQLVCQQLHGHLLILFIGLVEEFHRQLGKLSRRLYRMKEIQCSGSDIYLETIVDFVQTYQNVISLVNQRPSGWTQEKRFAWKHLNTDTVTWEWSSTIRTV